MSTFSTPTSRVEYIKVAGHENVPAERPRLSREKLAPWPFWVIATSILIGCVIFHSRTDPGIRYSVKQLQAANFGPDWFLAQKFGKLTPCDVACGLFAYLGLVYRWATLPRIQISRRAAGFACLIAVPMIIGLIVGQYHDATSTLGADRYFLAGGLFAFGLWSTILTSEEGVFRFAQIFALVMGVYGFIQLADFARGGGEIAFYGRTPLAAHATLEYMVAGVAVSVPMTRWGRSRVLWWFTIATCSMVVILGFRRYAWIELAAVFGVFLILAGRKYLKGPVVIGISVAIAVVFLGSSLNWSSRFASLDPSVSRSSNIYATTNQGHIDAVRDGLHEIEAHPITGLGTGVNFVGAVTGDTSGQTQNAAVETWIRYSIVGEAVFFFAYFVLFRDLWRRRRGIRYSDQLGWGIGAYFFGQFIVIMAVYPWPFDTAEKAVLSFSMLAMAFPWRPQAANGPEPLSLADADRPEPNAPLVIQPELGLGSGQ